MRLMQSDIDTVLLRAMIKREAEKILRDAGVLPEVRKPKQPRPPLHVVKDADDA